MGSGRVYSPVWCWGGGASILITLAMVGILAAVAIPAYSDYTTRVKCSQAYSEIQPIKKAVQAFAQANQSWPEDLTSVGFDSRVIKGAQSGFEISLYKDGMVGVAAGVDGDGHPRYLVLEPSYGDGKISWKCYGQNISPKHLPSDCRN